MGIQSALHGGNLLNHHQCAAFIWLDDVTAAILHQNAHHTLVERRPMRDEANQYMGIIRRP